MMSCFGVAGLLHTNSMVDHCPHPHHPPRFVPTLVELFLRAVQEVRPTICSFPAFCLHSICLFLAFWGMDVEFEAVLVCVLNNKW